MSPTTRTPDFITHRAWLVMVVRAFGMLFATDSHHLRPFPAIRAQHVIMTPGSWSGGCVRAGWGTRAQTGRLPTLLDRLTTNTSSPPRLHRHVTRDTTARRVMVSPSLGLRSCQLISLRGRHLRMVSLSGR